jgi:sugar diacid utilization regulator
MTDIDERPAAVRAENPRASLERRYERLLHRYQVEGRLAEVAVGGGGIAALVHAAAELTANPVWLIDRRQRVVARSVAARGSEFRPPDVRRLVAEHGAVDLASDRPLLIAAKPARGLARRHLLVPVTRNDTFFAWLVVGEVLAGLTADQAHLAQRAAFFLSGEYAVQQRIASASWNALSNLTRQLVRGSYRDGDLRSAAEYLGVDVAADRVLVYVADAAGDVPRDEWDLSQRVAAELGVEVLGARGSEGTILLVEAADGCARVALVHTVKETMKHLMAEVDEPDAVVGVSSVTPASALQRAYRETREVVLCVDRFARSSQRVIAVDDLGPARLFVANGDVGAVRRYVQDVLGALLGDVPGSTDLLRTLQCFFDTGRSVRESAARLGIHENTVRLRFTKIHDLTGLDVASDANDQLSAQTALLVLRLEGHPAIPAFEHRYGAPVIDKETA